MTEYDNLIYEVSDRVGHIKLNRPDAANAFNLDLVRELSDAARRCNEDADVRAVLISGAGATFSVGGDLKSVAAHDPSGFPGYLERLAHFLHKAFSTLWQMNSPVVAAVHGIAAGAGLSLACACDFVIAAESAHFTTDYAQSGMTPYGSPTFFLPRIVGYRKALELLVMSSVLDSREALNLGIVTRVVPDEQLAIESYKVAAQLAVGPTMAYGAIKRLLRKSSTTGLDAQMEREHRWIVETCRSHDAREGIAAFLSKREPKFLGE
ncbi:MAG TPA: enoyl-CoA hydratase-related protein [Candidatus Binataceae bacterium]